MSIAVWNTLQPRNKKKGIIITQVIKLSILSFTTVFSSFLCVALARPEPEIVQHERISASQRLVVSLEGKRHTLSLQPNQLARLDIPEMDVSHAHIVDGPDRVDCILWSDRNFRWGRFDNYKYDGLDGDAVSPGANRLYCYKQDYTRVFMMAEDTSGEQEMIELKRLDDWWFGTELEMPLDVVRARPLPWSLRCQFFRSRQTVSAESAEFWTYEPLVEPFEGAVAVRCKEF